MNARFDKNHIDAKTVAIRAGMDGRPAAFEANVNARFATPPLGPRQWRGPQP